MNALSCYGFYTLITASQVVCLLFLVEPKWTKVLQTAAMKCCSLKFLLMGRSSSNSDSDLLQGAHVAARLGKAGCKDQCVQLIVSLLEEEGRGGKTPLGGEDCWCSYRWDAAIWYSQCLLARHHTRHKVHYLILSENKVWGLGEGGGGTFEYLEVTEKMGLGIFMSFNGESY